MPEAGPNLRVGQLKSPCYCFAVQDFQTNMEPHKGSTQTTVLCGKACMGFHVGLGEGGLSGLVHCQGCWDSRLGCLVPVEPYLKLNKFLGVEQLGLSLKFEALPAALRYQALLAGNQVYYFRCPKSCMTIVYHSILYYHTSQGLKRLGSCRILNLKP